MLSYLFSGSVSWDGILFVLLSYAILIFLLLPVHEFAHAFAADRMGDSTPRYYGRLTLNPLAHLDWLGALMLVLCGIGYAKPVPVNPRNFRNPRRGMVLTALAGPLSNLLMAAVSLGIFRIILWLDGGQIFLSSGTVYYNSPLLYDAYIVFVQVLGGVNIGLAVFNLLPIPPLDGSRIFEPLLPAKWSYWVSRYQRYITMGVMVLLLTGALDTPLYWLRRLLGGALCLVMGMPNLYG